MSIVVRYHAKTLTTEQYDENVVTPPAACDYHVCFGEDGHLLVSEVWDSREEWEAFAERLMPTLTDAGIELAGPPEIFEVHNIIKR
jgi:hypothetical protein